MDSRFKKINKLLSEYSLGNFNKKLGISSRLDEVDAFISGVNMLGEELKDRTISRDYFNNIFNSVSDMVFVLDKQGRIENINTSVVNHLQYSLNFRRGKPINYLLGKLQPDWFGKVLKMGKLRSVISLDLYNTLNTNTPITANSSFSLSTAGTVSWLAPTEILNPRLAKVSFQVDF